MKHCDASESGCGCASMRGHPRRSVLKGALALVLAPFGGAFAAGDARTMRPQPGDRFAYLSGPNKEKPVMAADLQVGQQPSLAYPVDPATGAVRNGSRVNQVLMIRAEPSALSAATQARAAEGIVAYSAICTHNGCPITVLNADKKSVVCNCHGSRFDLGDGGAVLDGPASRRLASLPVGVTDGFVTVAGAFSGALGPAPQ